MFIRVHSRGDCLAASSLLQAVAGQFIEGAFPGGKLIPSSLRKSRRTSAATPRRRSRPRGIRILTVGNGRRRRYCCRTCWRWGWNSNRHPQRRLFPAHADRWSSSGVCRGRKQTVRPRWFFASPGADHSLLNSPHRRRVGSKAAMGCGSAQSRCAGPTSPISLPGYPSRMTCGHQCPR